MKNKYFIALVVVVALIAIMFTLMPSESKAQAYQPVAITCVAQSPSAIGQWTHRNGQYACQRAVDECVVRTPYWQTCTVTRWWYVY